MGQEKQGSVVCARFCCMTELEVESCLQSPSEAELTGMCQVLRWWPPIFSSLPTSTADAARQSQKFWLQLGYPPCPTDNNLILDWKVKGLAC